MQLLGWLLCVIPFALLSACWLTGSLHCLTVMAVYVTSHLGCAIILLKELRANPPSIPSMLVGALSLPFVGLIVFLAIYIDYMLILLEFRSDELAVTGQGILLLAFVFALLLVLNLTALLLCKCLVRCLNVRSLEVQSGSEA